MIARAPVAQNPPRVCIGLYCPQGRIAEGREGIAHIAEHIAANTPRVVANPHARGATFQSNAFTRSTYTSFWTTTAPDGVRFAMQSRFGMLTGLRYRTSIMEEQRTRVLNEFNFMRERGHDHAAAVGLERMFFGGDPAIETEVANTEAFAADEVRSFIERSYLTDQSILAIVGDVDLAEVEEAFGAGANAVPERRGGAVQPLALVAAPRRQTLRRPYFTRPVGALGFVAPARASAHFVAFQVLDQLLLGGRENLESTEGGFTTARSMTSPLMLRLAARTPVAAISDGRNYGYEAPPALEGPRAIFPVIVTLESSINARRAEALMMDALRDCAARDLTPGAVEAAKAALLSFNAQWLGESNYRVLADHLAGFALFDGDVTRLSRIQDEFAAVTTDQVQAVMNDFILEGDRRFLMLSS